jgi:hypothetical protein
LLQFSLFLENSLKFKQIPDIIHGYPCMQMGQFLERKNQLFT